MKFLISFVCLFLGAVMFAMPNMTRRTVLFAVPVRANFRGTRDGRRSISIFRSLVALAVLADLCAVTLCQEPIFGMIAALAPLIVLLVAAAAFFWQKHKLQRFAVHPAESREADLSTAADQLPWFTWTAAGPFIILALAAAFLNANWDRIPDRFPIHWGADGQPNGWSERTIRGVYGPLLLATTICASLVVLFLAMWFGARRSHMRRIILGVNLATEYLLALIFATTSINPVIHIPLWIVVIAPMLFIIIMLLVAVRRIGEATDPSEPTPNERWHGGMIYYNSSDAALFVEKRTGLGYTLNFGNRWSWAVVAGLLLVISSSLFLL